MSEENVGNAEDVLAPWVQVQKKTFTKWTNSHLKKVGTQINDIANDFENGVKLMQLIKALYGLEIPKHNANPKMRPQKLDNISIAFDMVAKAQVKTNFLKTHHLVDHDLKMLLGMIWAIILDYQIKGISVEDLSAKDALLLWCQKKTKGYRDVKVDNFSSSWRDGLALAALIHKHRPDLIDFDSLNKDNRRENLQLCFDVAQRDLGIEPLLEAADVADVDKPDEKSIMTYISEFYHKFTSQNHKETAARRIQKFAQFHKSIEDMEVNYSTNAGQLLDWISQQISKQQERDFPNDLDETNRLISAHKEYKVSEKPKYNESRLDNETLHNNIQTRLKANKRKLWQAPSGLTVEDVDAAWERLGVAENERGKALRDHLLKQKDRLRKDFGDKANEFYAFVTNLKNEVTKEGSGDLQDQLNNVKKIEEQIESDVRARDLQELHQQLEALGLADENPYTDYTVDELLLLLDQVKNAIKKKKQFLQNQLQSSGQSNVTEDQINEIRETFKHFDKDGSNALDKLEFRACLQSLGLTYSDEEFNKLFAQLANGGEKIDLETFTQWMINLLQDTDDAAQIKSSFKVLANDKNTIAKGDLRVPPLNNDDIEYLASRMPGSESSFDYNTYTDDAFA